MESICHKRMNQKRRNKAREPNPMPQSSKFIRLGQSHPAELEWSTDEKAGREHSAQHCQPPGGTRHPSSRFWIKTENLGICLLEPCKGLTSQCAEYDDCMLCRNLLSFDARWLF